MSSGSPRAADTSAQDNAASRAPVVLYTASRCEACDLARGYLGRRKVAFTEKNVESNVALQDELKAKSGGLHVPTILVGDKVMRGYLESLLEGELDEAGYPKMSAAGPEETTATERGGLAPTR